MIILILLLCIAQDSICIPIPKEFIKRFLPQDPVVLEAGAAHGSDTVEMAKLWPRGKIYAFEPIPKLYREMKKNTKSFPQVVCYKEALSNKSGRAEFHLSDNGGLSSSLLKPAKHLECFPTVKFGDSVIVKTITIDQWAKREGVSHVDFIWLDMQGAEPAALMASTKILKTVKVVYSEISRAELYKGQVVYAEFKKFMQEQGFREIYEDTAWVHGNALFVRSDKDKVVLFSGGM